MLPAAAEGWEAVRNKLAAKYASVSALDKALQGWLGGPSPVKQHVPRQAAVYTAALYAWFAADPNNAKVLTELANTEAVPAEAVARAAAGVAASCLGGYISVWDLLGPQPLAAQLTALFQRNPLCRQQFVLEGNPAWALYVPAFDAQELRTAGALTPAEARRASCMNAAFDAVVYNAALRLLAQCLLEGLADVPPAVVETAGAPSLWPSRAWAPGRPRFFVADNALWRYRAAAAAGDAAPAPPVWPPDLLGQAYPANPAAAPAQVATADAELAAVPAHGPRPTALNRINMWCRTRFGFPVVPKRQGEDPAAYKGRVLAWGRGHPTAWALHAQVAAALRARARLRLFPNFLQTVQASHAASTARLRMRFNAAPQLNPADLLQVSVPRYAAGVYPGARLAVKQAAGAARKHTALVHQVGLETFVLRVTAALRGVAQPAKAAAAALLAGGGVQSFPLWYVLRLMVDA